MIHRYLAPLAALLALASFAGAAAPDRRLFEAHLKGRLAILENHHGARISFVDKEAAESTSFWNKVREERRLFEARITRQTMDMFESLASLEAKDHPGALSDFERMQNNVLRSFEAQQKKKIAGFVAEREKRWKEFVAEQDRERADFFEQTRSGWKRIQAQITQGVEVAAVKKPARKSGSAAGPAVGAGPD